MRTFFLKVFLSLSIFSVYVLCVEWNQDACNAQRTGFIDEEPLTPWNLRWTWNGPDSSGGTGNHFYHQPASYVPWEARTVTGGNNVYVPANNQGFYALRKTDGSISWRVTVSSFNATPAYDPDTDTVYAGADNGYLYKFNASNGQILGSYNMGSAIKKSILLANGYVYAVTSAGVLYKLNTSGNMSLAWSYNANSAGHTPPAYSAVKNVIVFCTYDLNVHCVNDVDGSLKWKVKPTPRNPGYPYEFNGSWPVIAEQHGIVFVRMNHGIGLIFDPGAWPATNAERRTKLQSQPQWKNLFALSLDNGSEVFIPAVGPQGVEDFGSSPNLRVHCFPVVKVVDGKEVAYITFRSSDTQDPGWDPRWDSHLGEMVLDNTTVSGYVAGDLRHIDFTTAFIHITDENCPLSMAGNTIFFSHWSGTGIHRITDRSFSRGSSRSNPITTTKLPPILRANTCNCGDFNPNTHYSTNCGLQYDHGGSGCTGRWYGAPGYYSYYGVLDPPTPKRDAYSEGILPRYTYVSDGMLIVEGNGGDLLVFSHSGTSSANKVAPPVFSPGGGTYTGPVQVSMQCATSNATIRYTTDNSEPTQTSTQYTSPITITVTTTLKAKAFKSGMTDSVTTTDVYIISGQQPSITVNSPNGGELWTVGTVQTVTWTWSGTVSSVNIDLSTNNGSSWSNLVSNTPNDGSQTITVPNTPSTSCRIRVQETEGTPSDISDGNFSVVSGSGYAGISVSELSLDFGEVPLGSMPTLEFSITSTGTVILTGTIATSDDWIIVNPLQFAISPQNSIYVMVTIDSEILGMREGNFSGIITINSNAGDVSIEVKLTATCVIVKPNPVSRDEFIAFTGNGIVPGKTNIKIFNLSGVLIKEINQKENYSWDCTDLSGNKVIPGVYLYIYESPKEKGIGKITVK